jgi:hypothetical protein
MRLLRGCERLLDPDVKLAASGKREPHAAARTQRLRLLELFEAEQVAEESTRLGFATPRRRKLNVV